MTQMIIADLTYTEEVAEANDLQGGGRTLGSRRSRYNSRGYNGRGLDSLESLIQSLTQSVSIFPASSASVLTLNGDSIGNTVISFNITMPILMLN